MPLSNLAARSTPSILTARPRPTPPSNLAPDPCRRSSPPDPDPRHRRSSPPDLNPRRRSTSIHSVRSTSIHAADPPAMVVE
nr:hypothetical protein CFP56_61902 [Quercus suber]